MTGCIAGGSGICVGGQDGHSEMYKGNGNAVVGNSHDKDDERKGLGVVLGVQALVACWMSCRTPFVLSPMSSCMSSRMSIFCVSLNTGNESRPLSNEDESRPLSNVTVGCWCLDSCAVEASSASSA